MFSIGQQVRNKTDEVFIVMEFSERERWEVLGGKSTRCHIEQQINCDGSNLGSGREWSGKASLWK